MTREMAVTITMRIANMRGNDTLPTEDVIDLAQVLVHVLAELGRLEQKLSALKNSYF